MWSHFRAHVLLFTPLMIVIGWLAVHTGLPAVSIFTYVLIGLASWTLIEYLMHRFFFHWRWSVEFMRKQAEWWHIEHHNDPDALEKILAHPGAALGVGVVLYGVAAGLLALLGWQYALILSAVWLTGVLIGYLGYETVHYLTHYSSSQHPLLRTWREHHLSHHYKDPEKNFGVTSAFWDHIFGTYQKH